MFSQAKVTPNKTKTSSKRSASKLPRPAGKRLKRQAIPAFIPSAEKVKEILENLPSPVKPTTALNVTPTREHINKVIGNLPSISEVLPKTDKYYEVGIS